MLLAGLDLPLDVPWCPAERGVGSPFSRPSPPLVGIWHLFIRDCGSCTAPLVRRLGPRKSLATQTLSNHPIGATICPVVPSPSLVAPRPPRPPVYMQAHTTDYKSDGLYKRRVISDSNGQNFLPKPLRLRRVSVCAECKVRPSYLSQYVLFNANSRQEGPAWNDMDSCASRAKA